MNNIYVIKNENDIRNQIKVGMTIDWNKREKQYKTSGVNPKLLLYKENCSFIDKDIHKILCKELNYKINKDNGEEWFILKENETDDNFVKIVKSIITSLKHNTPLDILRYNDFKLRDEQKECIDKTLKSFEEQEKEQGNKEIKFLWNCKMRFGKTFTSYQLIKKAQYKNTLILTYKVVVNKSWKEDLLSHIDFKDYNFIDKNSFNKFDISKNNVVFISIPLIASNVEELANIEDNENNENLEINIIEFKEKLKNILNIEWDLLIIDEAHYGIRTNDTNKILSVLKFKRKLELSGTPFKIIADSEYKSDQIYNWTYKDEQRKKKEYSYLKDKNPYKDLPDMLIYTYDGVRELINNDNYSYDFNLNELFTKYNEFEKIIKRIIDFMCGLQFDLVEDKDIKESNVVLPYFGDMINKNKKSLWFLPSVDSVCRMEDLLKRHKVFKDYTIINATGKGEGSSEKSLDKFLELEKTTDKIICLSCGMLNTGITIKSLNSVIILQNKNSAQDFFQSIFRCQSPYKDKKECYVFDFNPKRYFDNFVLYVRTNNKSNSNEDKKLIEDALIKTYLYLDGKMRDTTYDEIMKYINLDTNPDKVKKQFLRSNNINLDLLIHQDDNILSTIDKIPLYRNEKKENKNNSNNQNKPKSPKKKRTEEEKQRQENIEKQKKESQFDIRKAKLDVFISSLTIFIYITDAEEKRLKEIINTEEKELFEKICFITVEEFNLLYQNKFFKEEILDKAISRFYYEELVSRNWNDIINERVIIDN